MKKTYRIRRYHENKKVKDINVETDNIYELILKNVIKNGAKINSPDNKTEWTLTCNNGDVIFVKDWES